MAGGVFKGFFVAGKSVRMMRFNSKNEPYLPRKEEEDNTTSHPGPSGVHQMYGHVVILRPILSRSHWHELLYETDGTCSSFTITPL